MTPTLLGAINPSDSTHLRAIFLGGEAPSQELIKRWSRPGRRLYNAYGPTEATISITMAELRPDLSITLGSPIRNSRVFLLDSDMEIASTGQICISGPAVLALGYYKDDERTNARFVQWKGQRVYLTGDMAKHTKNGLVFLGREDSLVKNRGFLINIEAEVIPSLLSYPGIVSATAAMHRQRLIAFVAPRVVGDGVEIRKALARPKEQFLVPDEIIVMDHLPRTGNGKIDTKSLIQALPDDSVVEDEHETNLDSAPTSDERRIVLFKRLMASALQLPATSVDMSKSFSELGGNSLVALKAVSLLRQQGFSVSVPSLYSSPTLSALNPDDSETTLRIDGTSEHDDACTPAQSSGGRGTSNAFPLTSTQQGLIRSTLLEPPVGYMMLKISVKDMNSDSECFSEMLSQSWESVLSSIDIFRCHFDLAEAQGQLGHSYQHDWTSISVQQSGNIQDYVLRETEQLILRAKEVHSSQRGTFTPLNTFRYIRSNDSIHKDSSGVLLWFVHHALVDGHSVNRILNHVQHQLAYRMRGRHGTKATMSPLSTCFSQYANALDSHIDSVEDKAWDFWAPALEPVLGGLELNVSKPKTNSTKADFGLQTISAPLSTTKEEVLNMGISIEDFRGYAAAIDGVSTAVALHAAWALLLQRYASTNDVVFGSAISARNLPITGMDDMIGPVLNHCPIPVAIPAMSESRTCFLQGIQHLLLQVMEYQWSFPRVLEQLSSGSRAGLFSTALFLEHELPGQTDQNSSWSCERTDWPEFGLTMQVRNVGGQLSLRALYSSETYSRDLMKRVVVHFKNLVIGLVSPKNKTLGDVQMEMLGDLETLGLVRNNPTYFEPYHGPHSLKEALEQSFAQWGDKPAIESPSMTLSYRALDSITNFVGRAIISSVGPGRVVAVWGDSSIDWLVGALSVIKAGGTYLPLDTKLPTERMARMMETAGAALLILPDEQALRHSPCSECPKLFMDDLWKNKDTCPAASLQKLPTTTMMDDYAYIMFTSGTTGIPKGIRVTHRATLSHFASKETTLHARPGRRHAQVFSPGFDVSIAETFGVLCNGATLVLKDQGDPFAHLKRVHATMITPSLLSVLSVSDYALLDSIYLIGEAVPQALVDIWAKHKSVWNFYGPCECTIAALYRQMRASEVVTVGKALPRVGVYILDTHNMPAPVGVVGEIYLSGVQVMEGYIGEGCEAATARAFLKDPFLDGQRMYRTGDLGLWTEDMNVLFLGRTDHQVKVRGYRVELDEIEHTILKSSASVLQSAAIVFQDRIVAFAAPEDVDVSAIDEALRSSLPSYAVPQSIITLGTLPTTPNQKLDRKRLAEIALERHDAQFSSIDQEKTLAARATGQMAALVEDAWRDVLGLNASIGIIPDDDFMILGGHSLQQITVARKICSSLGKTIPFGIFIRNTRFASLVQAIEDFSSQTDKDTNNCFLAYCERPSQFTSHDVLSPNELEILSMHRESACPSSLNVAHIITLTGHVEIQPLKRAMELVGREHDILRTRYITDGDKTTWRSVLCEDFTVDVVEGKLDAHAVDAMINAPFDLEKEQLTRIRITQEDESHTNIVFVQHHVLCDQKSLQVFFRWVGQVYSDLQGSGSASSSLTRPAKYRSWASWKAKSLHKASDKDKERYWAHAFDCVKDNEQSQTWALTDSSLKTPAHLSSGIMKRPASGHDMEMFLAIVVKAYKRTLGVQDLFLGVPFIDRSELGTEDILGIMLDTIPLPFRSRHDNDADLESTVQVALRAALEHALPSSQVRKLVQKQRLVDVMVVYNRFEDRVTRDMIIPGTRITVEPRRAQGSKFPMLIEFTERGQDEIAIEFEYFTEAVSPGVADQLLACLRRLVSER